MARVRIRRVVAPAVWFAVVLVVGLWAVRFLFGTVAAQGMGPAAVFGLLVLATAVALLWRATLNMRRAVRRLRA
jgi:hypothetical protein